MMMSLTLSHFVSVRLALLYFFFNFVNILLKGSAPREKRIYFLSVQLDEFLQAQHTQVASLQIEMQNIPCRVGGPPPKSPLCSSSPQ